MVTTTIVSVNVAEPESDETVTVAAPGESVMSAFPGVPRTLLVSAIPVSVTVALVKDPSEPSEPEPVKVSE